jgi:asparagine synthase (glutamine-hydrolysing)
MCGICGLYGSGTSDELTQRVRRMVGTIVHRGPDAEGTFVADRVALGHRRLSILDLSAAGAQPMTLGTTTVVYNGESYNFRELRAELEQSGRRFRGHSDTEVLLHAYEAWGLEGLSRLEGIFAFALWDAPRRRLLLMRDRLGVKPLYYAWKDGSVAFGSEIKAILAATSGGRTIDPQALTEYLWYGNSFEDRTIFRDIRALSPGHRLIADDSGVRIEPWWRIEEWLDGAPRITDPNEAASAVRGALDRAVSRQLVSDVPVGILLSGGVDSSSICASAVATGARGLSSYAIGFDFEGGVNELPKAKQVAELLGLEHHELQVRGGALDDVLMELVTAHDEPFADAANIPLFLLGRQLRGSIKVVLQGDGGDEMFAGYRRYAVLRNVAWWTGWPRFAAPFLNILPGDAIARLSRMAAAVGRSEPALRMGLLLTQETLYDPPSAMLRPDARLTLETATDPFLAFRHCAARFDGSDPVQQMLLTDISLQLPSQFLTKVDRAMMANGIEARVPFLDEQMASLAVALPSNLKVRGGEKKIVLRDAMRSRLPSQILDGPKTGFGVPYESWLRGALYSLASSAILDPRFVDRFGFDRARLERALGEHRTKRRNRGFLLWKLLQLSLWSKCYLP